MLVKFLCTVTLNMLGTVSVHVKSVCPFWPIKLDYELCAEGSQVFPLTLRREERVKDALWKWEYMLCS